RVGQIENLTWKFAQAVRQSESAGTRQLSGAQLFEGRGHSRRENIRSPVSDASEVSILLSPGPRAELDSKIRRDLGANSV
ncbi:hypothetical protein Q0M89_14160, partial [Staphylococcus aureus]|nr:hypothetical protein [Staphylococcus aureus]